MIMHDHFNPVIFKKFLNDIEQSYAKIVEILFEEEELCCSEALVSIEETQTRMELSKKLFDIMMWCIEKRIERHPKTMKAVGFLISAIAMLEETLDDDVSYELPPVPLNAARGKFLEKVKKCQEKLEDMLIKAVHELEPSKVQDIHIMMVSDEEHWTSFAINIFTVAAFGEDE